MKDKICCKCKELKGIEEFYRDKSRSRGRDFTCVDCRKDAQRERDKTPGRIEKSKRWLKSERGKELYRERYNNPSKEEKAKRSASRAIRRLIKLGVITRQPSEICNNLLSKGHHPDYSEPLKVVWLCQKHHAEAHRK